VGDLKGHVPRFVGSVPVYRIAEGSSYTEASLSADKVDFGIEKWGALIGLTEELMKFSNPNIIDILINAVGRAFADKERELFTLGTGINQPKGITTETFTSPITFNGYASLRKAYYTVKQQYRKRAVWLTSSAGIQILSSLTDSIGRPLWSDGFNETPATIFGRPVYEIPEIPSNLGAGNDETEIYFGDFSYYYIFDYGSIESYENDILGWKEDVFYMKFRKYFDGKMAYFAEGVNVVKITGVK
jgi:HK97 family phage major capsid protein